MPELCRFYNIVIKMILIRDSTTSRTSMSILRNMRLLLE